MGEPVGRRVGSILPSCLVLVAVVLVPYAQVGSFGTIPLDDVEYVTGNPAVSEGLSPAGVRWAFTAFAQGNWHPLTWISHMADVSVFGIAPGAHHLVNVSFHLLNTLLLFRFFALATGRIAGSMLVAALFAVHPLHVESVVWIAERKDVLCAFFGFLALNAYLAYVSRPGVARYALVLLSFVAGLMSKPMLVTFPFILLLLDRWPLGRLAGDVAPAARDACPPRSPHIRLLLEKIPLFALSAASSAVTLAAQRAGGAVGSAVHFPAAFRIGNAVDAYGRYLLKTAWPVKLAVFYPHPVAQPPWPGIAAGGVALLTGTLVAMAWFHRRPWFATGWFWFLGMMVPVIGLVQVGGQAMADRYTYMPLVGLFILLVRGGAELADRLRIPPRAVGGAAFVFLALLAFLAWRQVGHWRGTVFLFRHAAESTRDNWLAHSILGDAALDSGDDREAVRHFRELIRIRGRFADKFTQEGCDLAAQGRDQEAVSRFRDALRFRPGDVSAHGSLYEIARKRIEAPGRGTGMVSADHAGAGMALAGEGWYGEGAAYFRAAADQAPEDPVAHYDLAVALWRMGRKEEALGHFRAAASMPPVDAEAMKRIGTSLMRLGRPADALPRFLEALRLAPGDPEAAFNAGIALGLLGKADEALPYLRSVVRSSGGSDADALLALGEALEAVGRTSDARGYYRDVLRKQPGRVEAVDRLEAASRAPGA